jgi:hypothetical protein
MSMLRLAGLALVCIACTTPTTTISTSFSWQSLGTQPLDVNIEKGAGLPSLALDSSGNPTVAWYEGYGSSFNIYVKHWDGNTWNLVGNTFLNDETNQSTSSPSLALDSSGNPTVAWYGLDGKSYNIYVKRWDGNTWNSIGSPFGNYTPSLALDSNGNPTVATTAFDIPSGRVFIYVSRWDGSAWNLIGSTFLNVDKNKSASHPSLVLDKSGNPTLAWFESNPDETSANVYVKHWDGSNWSLIGDKAIDININKDAYNPSLAFDINGNLVVAWQEYDNVSGNIYVKRWNGSSWNFFGNALDININKIAYVPSLALDSSGNPTVGWIEADGVSTNAYVKHWDGATWNLVGTTFLDVNNDKDAYTLSLALDSAGKPTVTWQESDGVSRNVYVKRYSVTP